jgi:hypothetical protein
LLVGGAAMPEPSQLPGNIRKLTDLNAVRVDSGRDFDHHMNGLIRAIDKILGTAERNALTANALSNVGEKPFVDHDAKGMHQALPVARATPKSLFFPLVGGFMTAIGLLHIGWFTSNLLTALSTGTVQQMFHKVWTFADMTFGFGGLIIGIGTIFGAHRARSSGIVLCLVAVSGNLLWFIDNFGRGLPRMELLGTGVTTVLAMCAVYLLLVRWPSPVEK